MTKIYVLIGYAGQDEEYSHWIVAAYGEEGQAYAHKGCLDQLVDKLRRSYSEEEKREKLIALSLKYDPNFPVEYYFTVNYYVKEVTLYDHFDQYQEGQGL